LHHSGTKPARHDDYTKGICYIRQRQGDENNSEHLDSHKQLYATATLLFMFVHSYQKYFIEHSRVPICALDYRCFDVNF